MPPNTGRIIASSRRASKTFLVGNKMSRRRSDIAELDISPEVFSFLLRLVDLRRNSRTFSEPCIVAMASHSGQCMGTAAEISQIESGTVEAWWSLAAPLTICCQFTLGQDQSNHGYDLCSSDKLTMICLGQQYEPKLGSFTH